MAFVIGMSSCSSSSNDDTPETPLAAQVAGSYSGKEVVMVNNEESSNETKTYEFTRANDVSIDIVIPEIGMGMMSIPAVPVKGILLTNSGNTITGKLAVEPSEPYTVTVKNGKGEEKECTVKNLVVKFSDKTVAATLSLKYGNMPFWLDYQYTGTKK